MNSPKFKLLVTQSEDEGEELRKRKVRKGLWSRTYPKDCGRESSQDFFCLQNYEWFAAQVQSHFTMKYLSAIRITSDETFQVYQLKYTSQISRKTKYRFATLVSSQQNEKHLDKDQQRLPKIKCICGIGRFKLIR